MSCFSLCYSFIFFKHFYVFIYFVLDSEVQKRQNDVMVFYVLIFFKCF